MKKVLIISHHFPPINTTGARRFGEMAGYMEALGWQPWIITTNSEGSLPINIPESQIVRIGANILQLTLGKPGNHKKTFWRKLRFAFSKFHIVRLFKLGMYGPDMTLWFKQVLKHKNKILKRIPEIDCIIATYGPSSNLWLGRKFAQLYKAPWIADFRDLAAKNPVLRNTLLQRNIDKKLEYKVVKSAKLITTVSSSLSKVLHSDHHIPTEVVYNGWYYSVSQAEENIIPEFSDFKPFMYYAGLIYNHRLKPALMILEAMRKYKDLNFLIRSYGFNSNENTLIKKAIEYEIEERVRILPYCDHKQVLYEAQNATLNLVFEVLDEKNLTNEGALTGKFFTLLPIEKVPIMFIANKKNEAGEILNKTKKGRLCSNFEEVCQMFDDLSMNNNNFQGHQFEVDKFSRKHQAGKLCEILSTIT